MKKDCKITKNVFVKLISLFLTIVMIFVSVGCTSEEISDVLDIVDAIVNDDTSKAEISSDIDKDGEYSSKEDVALYINLYGHLPKNFITKAEAKKLGWNGGSLEEYAKGCAIGGDTFKNLEGLLPKKDGRTYTECDIDTVGENSRGAKRIVFSNDGLIYYTEDHYESFILLYGEE